MNSKSKWLGLLLVVTLLLTGLASTVMAAPAAVVDNDQDGLTINTLNPANSTDPNDFNWDTDGDGLCDGDGGDPGCLNPVGEDLDQDGVLDPGETDNTKADTDGDGVPDGWERVFSSTGPATVPAWLAAKYNPLLVGKTAGCGVTDPRNAGDALLDNDPAPGQDGLTNLQEFQGVAPYQPTSPCMKDTDGDGVSDGDEALGVVNGYKSDPNDKDSDDDGLDDAAEGANLTDPEDPDTDDDGMDDNYEVVNTCLDPLVDDAAADPDTDGLTNAQEQALGTDPCDPDTDGDGMPDGYEDAATCLDPLAPEAGDDPDKDGLNNLTEYWGEDILGTPGNGVLDANEDINGNAALDRLNPCDEDTDGDGIDDGWEYAYSKLGDNHNTQFTSGGNFCNQHGFSPTPKLGVMNPFADDAAADPDKDGVSNFLEYHGIDLVTAPLKTFDYTVFPAVVNPADDWTSPCDPMTDNDKFIDGFEYWSFLDPKQTLCTAANGRMNPRLTVDADASNWDADDLALSTEYAGKDGLAPAAADIVALIPGDPKGSGWEAGDPWFRFQPSGKGADATSDCNPDTDRGGVKDGQEYFLNLKGNYKTDDKNDRDGDGIADAVEDDMTPDGAYTTGAATKDGETDFADPDTDKDSLCDGPVAADGEYPGGDLDLVTKADNFKVMGDAIYAWDAVAAAWAKDPTCWDGEDRNADGLWQPKGADADAATLADNETWGVDWDSDNDGGVDSFEVLGLKADGKTMFGSAQCLDPNLKSDLDGTAVAPKNDLDKDGLLNWVELYGPGTGWHNQASNDGAFVRASLTPKFQNYTDPCDLDTDDGGVQDGWEVSDSNNDNRVDRFLLDPLKGADDDQDRDLDGLTDVAEDANHTIAWSGLPETDYSNPDTDGDGLCDGKIAADGKYPAVALVAPYGTFDIYIVGGQMWQDQGGNGFFNDINDKFICQGGEDLNKDIAVTGDENADRTWNWLEGPDNLLGTADDIFEQWGETDPAKHDTDQDQLCDGPKANEVAPNAACVDQEVVTDALDADSDNDFLSDYFEDVVKTCLDPNDDDTDNDGLIDGRMTEIVYDQQINKGARTPANGWGVFYGIDGKDGIFGTGDEQFGEDLNGDGVYDADETDFCDADSDDDGVIDGNEWKYEYVDRDASGTFTFAGDTDIDADGDRPARDADSDNDNLCDGDVTNAANTGCAGMSKLIGEDVDGDGVWDKAAPDQETNPMDRDSDGDKVRDGVEVRWYETFDCAVPAYTAPLSVSAGTWDCDADGVRNALDTDSDKDGLTDSEEDVDRDGRIADDTDEDRVWDLSETWTETDPLNPDTDGDGINDGIEVNADYCNTALSQDFDGDGLLDPQEDRDGDGILDGDTDKDDDVDATETWKDTNPCNADTDDDSVEDYVEVWGWEWGNLISSGYPGMVEPKPMPDPDGDGKINAVDVDSDNDGWNDGAEDDGNGLIDYGGLFTNLAAFRGWAPQGGIPYAWNMPLNPAAAGWLEYARQMGATFPGVWLGLNFGYPVVGGPILPGQPVASGDWDRDRIIDAPYAISDPSTAWGGMMWEDWNETDPLNADTDRDGISDPVEDNAQYAGTLQQLDAGYCNSSNMWGPVTADQDGDGLLDGAEDKDADGIYFEAVPPAINDATTIGGTGTQPVAGPGATKGPESDPCNSDTDGDGVSDGSDVAAGGSPVDTDTDDDTLLDGVEIFGNVPGPYGKQICDPAVADSDGDGLKDGEEGSLGVDSYLTLCKDADTDDGGVSDGDEWFVLVAAGVPGNPLNGADDTADTDGDGINNYDELTDPVNTCLDPKVSDSDGDLLGDGEELSKYGTDPCDEDTDGDLIGDGDEILFTKTDPKDTDSDDDGLTDGEEVFLYKSDPNKKDTDGDGLTDGDEVKVYGTDPNKKDTDGDGMNDKYEVSHACLNPKVKDSGADADSDGLTNLQESKLDTDPCNKDTDGDGMLDGDEAKYSCLNPLVADASGDADSDGLTNGQEVTAGSNPCVADTDGDGLNDKADPWPLSTDGDKDGMPDAYEVLHPCLDPKVADANADPDKDGYTNIQEYQKGTDPCVFNCDIKYDWDQDNEVTVNDVLMMVPSWGATPASPNWVAAYDVDGDGVITVIDFMIVVNAIGTTCKLP